VIDKIQLRTSLRPEDLRKRSKDFALRVLRMFRALPRTPDAQEIGRQVLRSSMSMAANYRAACRARSRPEFFAKLSIVVEEMDETVFWLEMLVDGQIVPEPKMRELLKEANELVAIFAASRRTMRERH
jgi:four helix bundle protein